MTTPLQRAIETCVHSPGQYLIVNKSRAGRDPEWTVVKKVCWLIWFLRALFCCSPYNKAQTNKRALHRGVETLLNNTNAPPLALHFSIQKLYNKLHLSLPLRTINAIHEHEQAEANIRAAAAQAEANNRAVAAEAERTRQLARQAEQEQERARYQAEQRQYRAVRGLERAGQQAEERQRQVEANNRRAAAKLANEAGANAVKSFFQGKRVIWITGTPSPTLAGIEGLVALGKAPSLLPIDALVNSGVVPLSGTFGQGTRGKEQFNRRSLSGLQGTTAFSTTMTYANKGTPLTKENIKSQECAVIQGFLASFSVDSIIRTKVATYRLLTLDLLTPGEQKDFAEKLRQKLIPWKEKNPKIEHWASMTSYLGKPVEDCHVNHEKDLPLSRGQLVAYRDPNQPQALVFGMLLSQHPRYRQPAAILTSSGAEIRTNDFYAVYTALFPPEEDEVDRIPDTAFIENKTPPYFIFEEEIEALINALENPLQVYRTPMDTFNTFVAKPFPLAFGSTNLPKERMRIAPHGGGETLVANGVTLGEEIDFVLTDGDHVTIVTDFLGRIGVAERVAVFAISVFKQHVSPY